MRKLNIFKFPLSEKEVLKLRAQVMERGWHIKDLAQAIGYSPNTLYLFFKGRHYSENLHSRILQALEKEELDKKGA